MKFTEKQLKVFNQLHMEANEENYNKLYTYYKVHVTKELSENDLKDVTGGAAARTREDPELSEVDWADFDFDVSNITVI